MSDHRRLRAALLVSCLVALAGAGVRAGERKHMVRDGESASSIAKHYYGDIDLGLLLLYDILV